MTRPPPTALSPGDLPSSDAALCFEIYPAPAGGGGTPPGNLAALRSAVLAAVAGTGCADHAWHVDSFEGVLTPSTEQEPPWRRRGSASTASTSTTTRPPVFAAPPNTGDAGPCLWGRLTYGDAVADEWLTAWLLRHVTAALPGVAARVWDEEDGEFLLIEAAPGLPRWVSPDVAADRVWFYGGALHLVPPPAEETTTAAAAARPKKRRLPAGSPAQPSAAVALAFVRDPAVLTAAGPKVLSALAPRLDGAREAAARGVHRARVTLPAGLAAVLAAEPGLVAAATAAFVAASPAERRAASGGGGAFPATPLATVVARFSRLQYAQYALAPAAGGSSSPPPGWPALPPDAPADAAAARELGAKVSAGFALLLASAAGLASGEGGGPPADPAVLAALPEWRALLAALTARGAFDGEAEGSARARDLRAKAAADFAGSAAGRGAASRRAAPARRVRALLDVASSPTVDVAALEAAAAALAVDSDDWMADGGAALAAEVDALEARAAAEGAAAGAPTKPAARGARAPSSASPFDPAAVVAQVKAFVDGMSSFEGAEAPREPVVAPGAEGGAPPPGGDDDGGGGDGGGLSLDGADFWRELGACLGVAPDELFGGGGGGNGSGGGGPGADAINALFGSDMDEDDDDDDDDDYGSSEEEGSSFYDGPSDEEDDEDESSSSDDGGGRPPGKKPAPKSAAAALAAERARLAALERGRGASLRAGPPPEDEEGGGGPGFETAYAAALDAQLAGSTLAATFADGDEDGGAGGGRGGPAAAPGPIVPVDVDANLVASLLASHAGAGGGGGEGGRGGAAAADLLPGPAAGLAAMLGVRLPAAPAPPPPPPPPPPGAEPAAALAPPPATPNTSRG